MPSAKVTGMTFTSSKQMSGWYVEQKSQRENSQEFTRCDQIQCRQSESPSKSHSGKQNADTKESSKWLEWTGRITWKQLVGLGKVVWQ